VLGLIVQELPMMQQLGQFSPEYLEAKVEKAKEVLFHMSRTIDDFRNFFRPDKEKLSFQVSQALSRALSLIESSLRAQEITVEVNAADDPVIDGYPNEYSQALLNILINARDAFTERDVKPPRVVTVTVATEGDKAVMTIGDNAGGIPEDVMDKIFDPYFTTKGPDRGTGVGLFMAKTIIEKNMHGRLTVRNAAHGAEFRIEV
jgi:signal transduction histidine kinase